MVSRFRIAAVAGLVLLSGCGSGAPQEMASDETGITREQFIEIYVALRAAARDTVDAGVFTERKREILEEHGVDEAALIDFARSRGGDAQAMAELWDTIQSLLTPKDSTEQETPDSSTADSTAVVRPDSAARSPDATPGRAP